MLWAVSNLKKKRNHPVLPLKIRQRLARALAKQHTGKIQDTEGDEDSSRGRRMNENEDEGSRSRSRTPIRTKKRTDQSTVRGVTPEAAARRKKPVSLRAQGGVESNVVGIKGVGYHKNIPMIHFILNKNAFVCIDFQKLNHCPPPAFIYLYSLKKHRRKCSVLASARSTTMVDKVREI